MTVNEMQKDTLNDEEKRLASVMGIEPDDPLLQVLKPVAQLAQEMNAWKEIDLELLRFLRDTSQGVERTAINYEQLVNSFKILELQSKELTRLMQEENRDIYSLKINLDLLKSEQINSSEMMLSQLNWLKNDRLQDTTTTWSDSFKFTWVPLILAMVMTGTAGWIGWSRGQVNGYQVGRSEVIVPFRGEVNMRYWAQLRKLNQETMQDCQQQNQESCWVKLP